MAVPSKAISSVCAGGSILFCGSAESDSWFLNQSAGWLINENAEIEQQVSAFLATITHEEVKNKRQNAEKVVIELNNYLLNAYGEIAKMI